MPRKPKLGEAKLQPTGARSLSPWSKPRVHYLFFTLQRSAPRVRGAETIGADPAMLGVLMPGKKG